MEAFYKFQFRNGKHDPNWQAQFWGGPTTNQQLIRQDLSFRNPKVAYGCVSFDFLMLACRRSYVIPPCCALNLSWNPIAAPHPMEAFSFRAPLLGIPCWIYIPFGNQPCQWEIPWNPLYGRIRGSFIAMIDCSRLGATFIRRNALGKYKWATLGHAIYPVDS